MNPDRLWQWTVDYTDAHGHPPLLRTAAKELRASLDELEAAVLAYDGWGYIVVTPDRRLDAGT